MKIGASSSIHHQHPSILTKPLTYSVKALFSPLTFLGNTRSSNQVEKRRGGPMPPRLLTFFPTLIPSRAFTHPSPPCRLFAPNPCTRRLQSSIRTVLQCHPITPGNDLNGTKPSFQSIAMFFKYEIMFTNHMVRKRTFWDRCRVPLCTGCKVAKCKVSKHCYNSLLPPPPMSHHAIAIT